MPPEFRDLPLFFFSTDDSGGGGNTDSETNEDENPEDETPDLAPDEDDPFASLSAEDKRKAHKELEDFRKAKADAEKKKPAPKVEEKPKPKAEENADDDASDKPDPAKERAERRLKVKAALPDVAEELDVALYNGALRDAIAAGDFDKIGLDDDGEPDAEQMGDVLRELMKRKPWLIKKGTPVKTNATDTGRQQAVISDDDIAAAGRKYGIGR